MGNKARQGSAAGKPIVAVQRHQRGSGTISTPNATALKLQNYSVKPCHIKACISKKGGS